MTEQTALATRDLTDKQILQRIELNKKSGWGLEKGSAAQLNMVFLYCQKLRILPGDDVTLYEGKPWLTIDGRVKLMRRHAEYMGYSTRPLPADEKELWGYDAADVVIQCDIRTRTWGVISARGKVTRNEIEGRQQRGNPVAKIHWVELAEKRAIGRCERMAFGADAALDDEEVAEEVRMHVEERTDPARVALNAARYDQVFGTEEERDTASDVRTPAEHLRAMAQDAEAQGLYDQPEVPSAEAAEAPNAVGPQYRCVSCLGLVTDQRNNQPINESQAGAIVERFGELVCRSCRPKEHVA